MLSQNIEKFIMEKLKVTTADNIQDVTELSDGKSGACVYRVKVQSSRSRNSGIYIIKCLDTHNKWYSHSDSEAERCKQLHDSSPESFRERLVELKYDTLLEGQHILIYRQANDSIIHSISLDKLASDQIIKYLSIVSEELLTRMNADCLQDSDLCTTSISDFFKTVLDYRINNSFGSKGSFYEKLEDMLRIPYATAFQIEDKEYPNPGYYLQKQEEWIPTDKTFNLRKGLMHGDLHCKNIICVDSEVPAYSIIDYDSFKEEGYLFFDQAYLELYMYLYNCNGINIQIWEQTLRPLLSPGVFDVVSAESIDFNGSLAPMRIRNAISESITKWMNMTCKHMKDDIEVQFILARIAAGINFFAKGGMQNYEDLEKILIYIGINFEILFKRLGFVWSKEIITVVRSPEEKQKTRELLWENCVRIIMSYTPVLVTDDIYKTKDYDTLETLSIVPWGMVLDCGEHIAPQDFSTIIPQKMINNRHIEFYSDSTQPAPKCASDSCTWLRIKKEQTKPYMHTLVPHQSNINKMWNSFLSVNGLGPYLFIFDCKYENRAAQKILQLAIESISRLKGSCFISLQQDLFDKDEISLFESYNCKIANFSSASLLDISDTIQRYYSISGQHSSRNIVFPCLETITAIPLTEKEITFYRTSVELVHPSLAFDIIGNTGDEIKFYQGNEISWSDIAHNFDLRLLDNYDERISTLKSQIEQGTPHIKILKIQHGAGSGGTTLSKRILWDMKEITPTLRLIRYTQDTANIILDIYNKCKKTVLLSVEVGPTVISSDEIEKLCMDVHAQNGRLWILQVERKHNTNLDRMDTDAFIHLSDTLPLAIARQFYSRFKNLTKNSERIKCLAQITNDSAPEWISKRCPFFYGFYTYEEDYSLRSLHRTIEESNQDVLNLLSDIALSTIYSQNISMSSSEMANRIHGCVVDANSQMVYESLDTSISKFIVNRNNGWRICHPIIAKTILEKIYKVDNYTTSLYLASIGLVDRLYAIYGENDEHVTSILRELFIDRTEVDNEKMKFSRLVEEIPEFSKRKALFEKLIVMYQYNAHYYNHLARLQVSQESPNYEEAIALMEKAIEISSQDDTASIHYVTLGSVYTKKTISSLFQIQRLRKSGRLCPHLQEIIADIQQDFLAASNAFVQSKNCGVASSSYVYFPHILLECRVIENLVECDKQERSINKLFQEETCFQDWYYIHYGAAVQIFEDMQRNCSNSQELIKDAGIMLDRVALKDFAVETKLRELIQNNMYAHNTKRTYVAALYSRNHYSWDRMDNSILELIEKAMRQNLNSQLKGSSLRDVDFWFEAYRRLPSFNVDETIQVLSDYKEDGYKKEYLLSILYTLKLEKGLASTSEVIKHINACKNLCPGTINTAYSHDAYSNATIGCPVIPISSVSRSSNGKIVGLKVFSGTILSLRGGSSGIILIDDLNLEATFVPAITDEAGIRREFTTDDRQARVSFNIMFSYSGLRAWNVTAQNNK